MLILSRHKDYYDYLQGIYGVDKLLVLDRTKFTPIPFPASDYDVVKFYICDYEVHGMWMGGRVLYGEDLIPYGKTHTPRKWKWMRRWEDDDPATVIHVSNPPSTPTKRYTTWDYKRRTLLMEPRLMPRAKSPNRKLKCPILIDDLTTKVGEYDKHPILKQYNMERVYTPEKIWMMLSEWLSSEREEVHVDTRTDKEKIASHGFDTKTSFRKM